MLRLSGMDKQHGGSSAHAPDFASIKQSVQTLVDHGSEAVGDIKARVSEVTNEARDTAAIAIDEAAKFIKEHPGKSVALAFGIGYVAMRIRTSFLFPLAMIGGLSYIVKRKFA